MFVKDALIFVSKSKVAYYIPLTNPDNVSD